MPRRLCSALLPFARVPAFVLVPALVVRAAFLALAALPAFAAAQGGPTVVEPVPIATQVAETVVQAAPTVAQAAPTVAIIVRHAEKGTTPANDPPLTDAGTARAKALAAALANANVQAVITTQLVRTRDTARPVADARGLTTETVPVSGAIAEHAKAVADAVRKHAGQTVLVVGHSNTVTQIIAALGGPKLPELCDSQYSNLYTVVLDGTSARLVTSTYGAPSPEVATGCPAMK